MTVDSHQMPNPRSSTCTRRTFLRCVATLSLGSFALALTGCGGSSSSSYTTNDAADIALDAFIRANPSARSKGKVMCSVSRDDRGKVYVVTIDWVYFGEDGHFENRYIYTVDVKTGACHHQSTDRHGNL